MAILQMVVVSLDCGLKIELDEKPDDFLANFFNKIGEDVTLLDNNIEPVTAEALLAHKQSFIAVSQSASSLEAVGLNEVKIRRLISGDQVMVCGNMVLIEKHRLQRSLIGELMKALDLFSLQRIFGESRHGTLVSAMHSRLSDSQKSVLSDQVLKFFPKRLEIFQIGDFINDAKGIRFNRSHNPKVTSVATCDKIKEAIAVQFFDQNAMRRFCHCVLRAVVALSGNADCPLEELYNTTFVEDDDEFWGVDEN
eukprot:TRINITY_DN3768_c0_g1_i1.p1 TRINITY_DN3768_c0_g1~~TRINITY_DN3768_c0_g1_i1.p1  ORF type:complete len:252 (+),score=47.00 TRINITY_DN3768_c0_g1_i1:191-946(+)